MTALTWVLLAFAVIGLLFGALAVDGPAQNRSAAG